MDLPAYREPMTVRVVEGDVVILGPDGVAVSITPDSAEESARRLLEGARLARDYRPPRHALVD